MNPPDDLDAFRALVLANAELQAELAAPTDADAFAALVVETARRAGLAVDALAVQDRLRAARHAQMLRWI